MIQLFTEDLKKTYVTFVIVIKGFLFCFSFSCLPLNLFFIAKRKDVNSWHRCETICI